MENADGEGSFLLSFNCKCRVVEMIRVLLLHSKKKNHHRGVCESIQLFEALRECRCMSESVVRWSVCTKVFVTLFESFVSQVLKHGCKKVNCVCTRLRRRWSRVNQGRLWVFVDVDSSIVRFLWFGRNPSQQARVYVVWSQSSMWFFEIHYLAGMPQAAGTSCGAWRSYVGCSAIEAFVRF